MGKVIVIGASQGGVHALRKLVAGLPAPFPVPLMVVLHIGASDSQLPSLLSEVDGHQAVFAQHGQRVEAGRIFVAPPDRHMLLVDGYIELSRGPRENWARPAIDPLFRSAASAYGAEAIGIVLTGRLNDGTSGLFEIKRHGGIAIVQAPGDAEVPDMPRSALENVPVDYSLPISEMPRLLTRLATEASVDGARVHRGLYVMEQEPKIIEPSAQTCPECGGAMREELVSNLTRFRCHIGHAMTAEVLAAQQLEMLENDLSSILRLLNERAALCRDIAEKHSQSGNLLAAETWQKAADQAVQREKAAQIFTKSDWIHPEAKTELESEQLETSDA